MKEIFEIGIVTGVHGIKGDLKVFPYTSDPENLSIQRFFLINGKKKEVRNARMQGKFLIVKLDGIDTREAAIEMKGVVLSIPRENAAPLPDGIYYMEDLLGCSVYEKDVLLGVLDDIIETGANDVYSVIDVKGREILIPAIKEVVLNTDVMNKRIDVALLEGLLEDDYI